jgi:hypothetical protein
VRQNKVGEQQLLKLCGHFSLVLLLSTSSLFAESFADFKKSQQTSFQEYKDARDAEFNKYLKAQWKAFNVYKGTPLYEEPKPAVIPPVTTIQPIKKVGPPIHIVIKQEPVIETPKEPETPVVVKQEEPPKQELPKVEPKQEVTQIPQTPQTVVVAPKEVVAPVVVAPKKDIEFDFYGSKVGFTLAKGLKNAKFYPKDKAGISNFFDAAASSEYEVLVREIQGIQSSLNLNDWATYLLVMDISKHVFNDQDDINLMSWFLFNKLGYSVKIGLANNHIVLMHYSKKIIYATPNYTISNKKYYVVSSYNKGSVGQLYSYEQNYPGATKAMDLALEKLPSFPDTNNMKTISFKHNGQTYNFSYEYNKNLIDFMETYPQADYETYFNAPVETKTYQNLATELKKLIEGKKASEGINFVLNFVQNSFEYQRDDQQFNREKVMFAQETLYYDKSDCEDRAVLFSYLVKELFGVGVIGVKYKDHMATALYIPMDGDKVRVGSREFVVADPTYINASIGQSMPKYKPLKPESFVVVKAN